jgi:hypothetical protein
MRLRRCRVAAYDDVGPTVESKHWSSGVVARRLVGDDAPLQRAIPIASRIAATSANSVVSTHRPACTQQERVAQRRNRDGRPYSHPRADQTARAGRRR